ncbi:hypothetical protein AT5G27493 [Arabidopsis thaliana]|uniref:Uncharacterized protein n=2 Tax=Arabidopsis thaliana TaxID=3702 RepID=A0A1P8BBR5_ARATH|nr:uncharacterized protein AT5G27493 [Arabidopsis thaliana]ANM69022.1 hypothetical protein AT5G27493 [Arabidopsis thaliana]|eukprot:NP_001330732.1 hypothetical protein AT5G27493 [Arabidopsis thaliana]
MLTTIKNHLSPAELICALRFNATNVADMNPAKPAITHLKISNGTTERHCRNDIFLVSGMKTNREYPYRQKSWTKPDGAEKYLRTTYNARGTIVT